MDMKRELTVSLLALGVATCVLLLHHFLSLERARKVSYLGVPRTIQVEVLKVNEKGKGSISFSGGTSGFGGSFVGAGYSTKNFMGHGESISIQAQGGTRASQYVFTFTEP